MSLFFAELRKLWGGKFLVLTTAVLAIANLLFLWMGTQISSAKPPASAYRAVGQELSGMTMAQKHDFFLQNAEKAESLWRLDAYYRQLPDTPAELSELYRTEHAQMFERYAEEYLQKNYTLYTQNLEQEYQLFKVLKSEYDTVSGYADFLNDVQTKAQQLSGFSIFQSSQDNYTQQSIRRTAQVYVGLTDTAIDYYPQKGLYTAVSYPFTDILILVAILFLSLVLVRQEKDSAMLGFIRSTAAGRLKTAAAKLFAFFASLLAILIVLYGVNLLYCNQLFGIGPLERSIQSVPALMRSTLQISVGQYLLLFLLSKWAGAAILGLWVLLVSLTARHLVTGWSCALLLVLGMYGIRAAIPATSSLNVLKYANLASLLQTNELLGTYRNLYWFGTPVALTGVEFTAACLFGIGFTAAFCIVFARAQLLPTPKSSVFLFRRRTHPTTVWAEEARKLFLINKAGIVLLTLLVLGVYQGSQSSVYESAQDIYYSYYMKHISGPYTRESRDWLVQQGQEFAPLLQAMQHPDEQTAQEHQILQGQFQKYEVYQTIIGQKINGYLQSHPDAWLVYEKGYQRLFGLSGNQNLYDTILAGLACALCFAGLCSMERAGGMDTVLCSTPYGRKHTVTAKLLHSCIAAAGIAAFTCLPHLIASIRNYGLPALLAPAMSIPDWEAVSPFVSLAGMVLLWFVCRMCACLFMGAVTLWLGQLLGHALPTLCISTAAFCIPALLAASGMTNDIQWLGLWPLFSAPALLTVQGYSAVTQQPFHYGWAVLILLCCSVFFIWFIGKSLFDKYIQRGLYR